MVEPIKMPLGMKTQVGLRNHVLDGGGCDPHEKGHLWRESAPLKTNMIVATYEWLNVYLHAIYQWKALGDGSLQV